MKPPDVPFYAPDADDTPHDAVALSLRGVRREFERGETTVVAVDDVDLEVAHGALVALAGRSGSGKTTLLNIAGGLDRPTAGQVVVDGIDLGTRSDEELVSLRRTHVAYVFQSFGLLPVLSAAENVEIPLRLERVPADERETRVRELLAAVGLAQRADHRPHELSGGEQQRVAVARALASEPELLLADEPTGQLDSVTGGRIMDLLLELVDSRDLTVLVATHDRSLLDRADHVFELHDGRIT